MTHEVHEVAVPAVPRIGVGIVVRRGAEVLLLRRHGTHGAGSWSTPGGHLDFGESPEECAARECLEETGVTVGAVRFRGFTNDCFAAEGKHYVTLWMEGEYQSGEAAVRAAYEASDVGWFRMDDLPQPLFAPFQRLLAQGGPPSDREFLAAFEAAAIPLARWAHRDHVRMAYLYLRDHPFEKALGRVRSGIQALNRVNAVPENEGSGYHETLTVAWCRVIRSAIRVYGAGADFDEFIAAHPHLLNRTLLRLYYSRARIVSAQARAAFVEPDLATLPAMG